MWERLWTNICLFVWCRLMCLWKLYIWQMSTGIMWYAFFTTIVYACIHFFQIFFLNGKSVYSLLACPILMFSFFCFIFWASLHSDCPYIRILFKWLVGFIQLQVSYTSCTLSVPYLVGIGDLFWCFRYLTLLPSIVVVVLRIQIYYAIHESNLVSCILCSIV